MAQKLSWHDRAVPSQAPKWIELGRNDQAVALEMLAVRRLVTEHLSEWRTAYDGPTYRGAGSTYRRAKAIQGIYDAAIPLPDAVMPPPAKEFLSDIRRIVIDANESSGGYAKLSDVA